jgi:hypothetical protein
VRQTTNRILAHVFLYGLDRMAGECDRRSALGIGRRRRDFLEVKCVICSHVPGTSSSQLERTLHGDPMQRIVRERQIETQIDKLTAW